MSNDRANIVEHWILLVESMELKLKLYSKYAMKLEKSFLIYIEILEM